MSMGCPTHKKRPEPTNAGLGLGQNFPKPKKTQPDPKNYT